MNRLPGKLPSKVMGFFDQNPDEELTVRDAAVKFSASERAVLMAVTRLVAAGAIEYVRVVRLKSKGMA